MKAQKTATFAARFKNLMPQSVAQASLALTLTPHSIPTVFHSINSPWFALALLNAVRVPGAF